MLMPFSYRPRGQPGRKPVTGAAPRAATTPRPELRGYPKGPCGQAQTHEGNAELTPENAESADGKELACFSVLYAFFVVIRDFCTRLSGLAIPVSAFRLQRSRFKVRRSALEVQRSMFDVQSSASHVTSNPAGFSSHCPPAARRACRSSSWTRRYAPAAPGPCECPRPAAERA